MTKRHWSVQDKIALFAVCCDLKACNKSDWRPYQLGGWYAIVAGHCVVVRDGAIVEGIPEGAPVTERVARRTRYEVIWSAHARLMWSRDDEVIQNVAFELFDESEMSAIERHMIEHLPGAIDNLHVANAGASAQSSEESSSKREKNARKRSRERLSELADALKALNGPPDAKRCEGTPEA